MPWFVVRRALAPDSEQSGSYEYRVLSEEQIETIEPGWDWASCACDTEEEAQQEAEKQFWEGFDAPDGA